MLRTQKVEPAPRTASRNLRGYHAIPGELRIRVLDEADRADLPGLERVTERTWASIFAYAILGLVPTLLLGGLISVRMWLGELLRAEDAGPHLWMALGLGGVGILALFAWLVARLGRGDFAWSTDPEGISARGLFRRRRLRWTEITAAGATELGYYHLDGAGERISFTGPRLAGSAWQHLRRHDRHRCFQLGTGAQSLWAEYPTTELPFTWTNPARRPTGYLDTPALVVLGWVWVAALIVLLLTKDGWGAAETGLALSTGAGVAFVWLRSRQAARGCVRWCEVTPEGLCGETWGAPFDWRWEEIQGADLGRVGESDDALLVRGGAPPRELVFPLRTADRDLLPVIYTILRRLRYAEQPQAVPLPHWLQQAQKPEGEEATG